MWVVDSSDRQRIRETRDEFYSVVNDPEMRGVPVVVLANKLDMPNATKPSELIETLGLRQLTDRQWLEFVREFA